MNRFTVNAQEYVAKDELNYVHKQYLRKFNKTFSARLSTFSVSVHNQPVYMVTLVMAWTYLYVEIVRDVRQTQNSA